MQLDGGTLLAKNTGWHFSIQTNDEYNFLGRKSPIFIRNDFLSATRGSFNNVHITMGPCSRIEF